MSKNILGIFDGEDIAGVSALIDRLEKSSFDYLKLEGDGISITIGKHGGGEYQAAAPVISTAAPAPPAEFRPAEDPAVSAAIAQSTEAVLERDGIVVIKSPSYGLFYLQPEPGAPPYVTVGAAVRSGDTVGLVEIMKTFNAITSPQDGEVVAVHIKNEETLEPGQPLISIKVK